MEELTLVAKVKGLEPEGFVFITVTSGAITRLSYPALSEADLKAALHKQGISDDEIRLRIETARKHPA